MASAEIVIAQVMGANCKRSSSRHRSSGHRTKVEGHNVDSHCRTARSHNSSKIATAAQHDSIAASAILIALAEREGVRVAAAGSLKDTAETVITVEGKRRVLVQALLRGLRALGTQREATRSAAGVAVCIKVTFRTWIPFRKL